jgi:uncharacterized protein YcnI
MALTCDEDPWRTEHMSINRRATRLAARTGVTIAAIGVLTMGGAGIASAHVTAHSPDTLAKGGDAEITFRVPDEDDSAGTVKLEVDFSKTSPIGDADIKPVAGWTAKVNSVHLAKPVVMADTTITDAVGSIVWTAQPGTWINPGEFQEFTISVEGLPTNSGTMVMPAIQTYDTGRVVQWNQATVAGQPEPEHPAPHLSLADAGADAGTAVVGSPGPAAGTDSTARWLGGAGLLVGALALGFGLGAFVRSRRPDPKAPADKKEPQEASA